MQPYKNWRGTMAHCLQTFKLFDGKIVRHRRIFTLYGMRSIFFRVWWFEEWFYPNQQQPQTRPSIATLWTQKFQVFTEFVLQIIHKTMDMRANYKVMIKKLENIGFEIAFKIEITFCCRNWYSGFIHNICHWIYRKINLCQKYLHEIQDILKHQFMKT